MVAPTLTVEQYQYDDTGILLNGTSAVPFVDLSRIDGLDSAPFKQITSSRDGMDGGFVTVENEDVRTVTLEGTIYASPTNLETYLDSLKANFAPTSVEKPLYFKTDNSSNSDRLVFGKSLGLRATKDERRRLGIVDMQVQIECEDPRIYGVPVITSTWTRATSTGSVTLAGNKASPATLTVAGVIVNPTIVHAGVTFAFALTMISTDVLVIDLESRTAVLNGNTNVRNVMTLTGNWYYLGVGLNNFTFTGTGSTATITVTTRSAFY